MDFQECVESKKCPACGEKNGPAARCCGVCGADLATTLAAKELEPGMQAAPPPPPGVENKKELKPSALGTFLGFFMKDYLRPLAAGAGLILLLILVGEKKEAQAPPTAAVEAPDLGGEAMDIFMSYTLRSGADKGKTMRQYWAEYVTAFQSSRRKGDTSSLEVDFFQQAAGPGMYNIFVVEKVSREKDHLFPFCVNLVGREVFQAPGCVFAPGTEGKYAGAVCENSSGIFPEGL